MLTNTLTAEARTTIMDACQSISRSADALKECHSVKGDWGDDLDAKAFYDAELRLLGRLTALLDHPGQPEPRAEAIEQLPLTPFERVVLEYIACNEGFDPTRFRAQAMLDGGK